VRSTDDLLPARLHGAYRPEDVATEIVRSIDRDGRDSSIGAAMELWRVADLLLPTLTERVIGLAGALSLRAARDPSTEDGLAASSGRGSVEGGLHARPSALVAARSVLARFGVGA
jgi:hypothetical protein